MIHEQILAPLRLTKLGVQVNIERKFLDRKFLKRGYPVIFLLCGLENQRKSFYYFQWGIPPGGMKQQQLLSKQPTPQSPAFFQKSSSHIFPQQPQPHPQVAMNPHVASIMATNPKGAQIGHVKQAVTQQHGPFLVAGLTHGQQHP